jgi:hypothetical protein
LSTLGNVVMARDGSNDNNLRQHETVSKSKLV